MSENPNRNEGDRRHQAFFRPKPDGTTDPTGEAGWYLECERIRRGLSLQAASQATGVHEHHLRAIEMGMLENLPQRDEALKMIGAYAHFLGFDAEPIVRHFANHMPLAEAKEKKAAAFSSAQVVRFPLLQRLRATSRTPGGLSASVLGLMVLFGGLVWGMWPTGAPSGDAPAPRMAQAGGENGKTALSQTVTRSQKMDTHRRVAASVQHKEERLRDAAPLREDVARADDPIGALIARTLREDASIRPAPDAAAAPRGKAMKPPAPSSPDMAAAPGPRPQEKEPRRATQPPAPHASPSVAEPVGPSLHENSLAPIDKVPEQGLALRATNMIWVRLEDDRGTSWYSGFLRPGQVLKLPDDRALRLTAGDVHRLEWFVNGQRMGRLGQRGSDFISEPLGRFYKQGGLKVPTPGNTG